MTRPRVSEIPDFLVGGGEMGRLMRSMDWSRSQLGPIAAWPQSLRTTVSLCLASTFPISLAWGPGHVQIYNDGYWPICGGKHPQSMGQDFRACWASAWPAIGAAYERGLRGEASYLENQRMFLDRNGYLEETFFTFSFSPIRDESGKVGGLFHPVTEQTDKMLLGRRLRTLRDLTAGMVDAKSIADVYGQAAASLAASDLDVPFALFYALDESGAQANLAAATGLPLDSPACPGTIGMDAGAPWPLRDLLHRAAPVHVDGLTVLLQGRPCGHYPEPPERAILLPITVSGSVRPIAAMIVGVSSRLPLDEAYRGFFDLVAAAVVAAANNARSYETERKRAETLAELDRAKTIFFSNVSHEFRTPLTLMLGPIEDMLAEMPQTLAPAQHERLTLAHRNAVRLLKMVNALLNFSRIEAGRATACFVPTDLAALTIDLVSNFRSVCEKAGLSLIVNCPKLPVLIYVDRELWEQLVLNLVSNAFKFTLAGEIEVSLHPLRENAVALCVRDTGVGIPPAQLPHIFDRFHRVEGSSGRSMEGSGIGLALVQELAKLHGGRIGVDSDLGKGSIFRVILPLGRDHLPDDQVQPADIVARPASRPEAFVQEARSWLPHPAQSATTDTGFDIGAITHAGAAAPRGPAGSRIVLADDNADMRRYVAHLLVAAGYRVEAFPDGASALAACRAAPPDLLVSDVMMPDIDGFALLNSLRRDARTTSLAVILVSARAGDEAKIEGLAAGADDYIVKPFGARELLARVEAAISRVRLRRAASAREHELLDVIAIEQAKAALLATETRLDVALEAGRLGSWELDIATDTARRSPLHSKIFGYDEPLPTWGSRDFEQHVVEEDRAMAEGRFRTAAATGADLELECRIIRRDGDMRWIAVFGRPVRGDDGKTRKIFGIVSDITERKQTEAALRQAQKMEAIGTLTGGLAHDFNNLLAIVIGNLSLLTDRIADDDMSRELLADALDASWKGAELTRALLAFARRQALDPQILDLNEHVSSIVRLLSRTLGENIEISLALQPGIWPVTADPSQLAASLANLATNARDAMPDGGRLTISTANRYLDAAYAHQHPDVVPDHYAMVEIADSGSGMARDVVDRIFEPFFTTKQTGKGTGLGLSMVFGFMKQSDGHIAVDSEIGRGTIVRLFFRRAPDGQQVAPGEPCSDIVGGNETILLVEDHESVRRILCRQLRGLGYRVVQAEDGQAAMLCLAENDIDLLMTDVVMPGGTNGFQLATSVTARYPRLKIVLTTGYAQIGADTLPAGMDRFRLLNKPFSVETLSHAIRDALRRGQAHSAIG